MDIRVGILLENDIITKEIADYVLAINEEIIVANNFDESASEVFITHLAMASKRIEDDNIVTQMDDFILDDIKKFDEFDEVKTMIDRILETSPVKFPQSEVEYLWLHMVNIFRKKGGK